MKFYITGTRRGLGKALSEKYDIVDNLNEADVFINCKHDGFTLDKANHQLYYQGVDTTIVRFGLFDTPRVEHIEKKKMSVEYCVSVIDWVLEQKHRVKEITVCP